MKKELRITRILYKQNQWQDITDILKRYKKSLQWLFTEEQIQDLFYFLFNIKY